MDAIRKAAHGWPKFAIHRSAALAKKLLFTCEFFHGFQNN